MADVDEDENISWQAQHPDRRLESLMPDHYLRLERAAEKQTLILNFLREEIYTSTDMVAMLINVKRQAANVTLRRMAAKGLVVKDEVEIVGTKRTVPIWGITFKGVMEGLEPHRIASETLRHHKVGSVKVSTVGHTLGIQRCRNWWINIHGKANAWIPEHKMPYNTSPASDPLRWKLYPDALMCLTYDTAFSVLKLPLLDGANLSGLKKNGCLVAVEVELTRKSKQRYSSIINQHIVNIIQDRYNYVFYYCKDKADAESYLELFLRLAKENNHSFTDQHNRLTPGEAIKHFFRFLWLEGLEGR